MRIRVKKRLLMAMPSIVLTAILLFAFILAVVSIRTNVALAEVEPETEGVAMTVKFNPTGTHIHKGFLKVRIDLYPSPENKTYALHYIQVPVIPPEGYLGKVDETGSPVDQKAYDAWIESLPKVWQLNPALCHFIVISETTTLEELESYIQVTFDADTIASLDDYLILPNSADLVSPFMRSKLPLTRDKITTTDLISLIDTTNEKLLSLSVPLSSDGKVIDIEPQTIDIGSPAEDRVQVFTSYGLQTVILKENPAEASGVITTLEIWANTNLGGCRVGTFYTTNGNTLKCRDSVTIGSVTAGSKQTFTVDSGSNPLAIVVEAGDYIGVFWTSGKIETDGTGYVGIWAHASEHIDPGEEFTYNFSAGFTLSLSGTGTEAGTDTSPPTIPRVPAIPLIQPVPGKLSLVLAGCAVIFFSELGFWRRSALLFMLAGGASLMVGLQWYDVYVTPIGLTAGLMMIAYSLVCIGFAFRYLLWRDRLREE